jgi:hypothetical protein
MAERLSTVTSPRFEVVGPFDETSEIFAGDVDGTVDRVRELCHVERVQEVMIADADGRFARLARALAPRLGTEMRVRLLGPWAHALPQGAVLEEIAGVALLVPAGGQRPNASLLKRTIDVTVATLGLLFLGPVAVAVRLHAATAGDGIDDQTLDGATAAGEPAPIPSRRVGGEAAPFAGVLNRVSDLGLVLAGRMSLVGVHRLPAAPRAPSVECRGVLPGLIVPPSEGVPTEENIVRADVAYVLGWTTTRDVRLVVAHVIDRLFRRTARG